MLRSSMVASISLEEGGDQTAAVILAQGRLGEVPEQAVQPDQVPYVVHEQVTRDALGEGYVGLAFKAEQVERAGLCAVLACRVGDDPQRDMRQLGHVEQVAELCGMDVGTADSDGERSLGDDDVESEFRGLVQSALPHGANRYEIVHLIRPKRRESDRRDRPGVRLRL